MTPHSDNQLGATPPYSLEAEQRLLGVMLYNNATYERLPLRLQAGHFFEPFHQRLFQAIESRIRVGELAEPILLTDHFKQDVGFDALGGLCLLYMKLFVPWLGGEVFPVRRVRWAREIQAR